MRSGCWAIGSATAALAGCSSPGTGTDPRAPATIELSAPRTTLVTGETVQLSWTVKDGEGAAMAGETVTFSSSAPATATVSAGGLVTAAGAGPVSISAKAGVASEQLAFVVGEGGVVTGSGASLAGFGGAIELVIPVGAVSAPTVIRLEQVPNPLLDPTAVGGSVYQVGSDDITFAVPASLSIRFDPATRPTGLPVGDIRLRRFDGSAWAALPGGSADPAANRAIAELSAGGVVSAGWVPPDTPCLAAEHRQFDFWLGAWSVSAGGQDIAQSDITEGPGGCAVFEHYRDNGGTVGRSISFYQPATGKWYQTYLDNRGNRLVLDGSLVGGAMVLLNPPGGGTQHERWRWSVEGARVRQQATFTANGGASYSAPSWDGLYTRR